MRIALQMFTTFLTSGATDVGKMLLIYRRDGNYTVAFHEFLKSVMLQDRAYYKEDQSPILNIFNCTGEKNSSHFTAMRILATLLEYRSESSPEGRGYVELGRLVGSFADIFDNVKDVSNTLDRLVSRQLIETNTWSTETVGGASHIRVTAAGWYYLKHLAHKFAYLDLVLQDTPLNNEGLEHDLRHSVYQVNNLADREFEKLARMKVRFDRTQAFIEYLAKEELRERDWYDLGSAGGTISESILPNLQKEFTDERAYIEDKLQEGKVVDAPDHAPDINYIEQFGLSIESDEDSEDATS